MDKEQIKEKLIDSWANKMEVEDLVYFYKNEAERWLDKLSEKEWEELIEEYKDVIEEN